MNTIPTTGQKIKIPECFENEVFEVKQWRDTPSGKLYNNGIFFCYYEEQDIDKFELVTE